MPPAEPEGESLLPRLWARRIGALAALALAIALVAAIRSTLMPFLLAWLAAYLVSPLVDALERRLKVRREKGVIVVMLLSLLVVVLLLALAIPVLVNESSTLLHTAPVYRDRLLAAVNDARASGRIPPHAEELARRGLERLQEAAPRFAEQAGEWLFSGLSSLYALLELALDLLLGVFVFYYFLRDFHAINRAMIDGVPPAYHDAMKDLLGEIDANLRTVLRGQFLVALAMASLYAIGLWIAGVPYCILVGLMAGFGSFLPYIGPMLAMGVSLLFVLLHSGGDTTVILRSGLGVLVVFSAVQFTADFFLTPRIAGESVGLGPVAVLFALSVGGALFGLAGIVAALPAAAIAKVLLRRGWNWYRESPIYRGV